MPRYSLKGHVAMMGANTMWGLMAPVAKAVMAAGVVSPLLMTNFRIAGAALLFWCASALTRREHVPTADKLLLAGAALLGTGSHHLSGKGDNPVLGDVLVLTAQVSYALYLTFYRNFIKKYSVLTLMKWMFTFAAIVLVPVSAPALLEARWHMMGLREALGCGYVVFFATFVAYICVMIGQKNLRPTLVGIYNYVQPIVATGVGVWLGLESFGPRQYLAVGLIFGGVFLVTTSRARQAPAGGAEQ